MSADFAARFQQIRVKDLDTATLADVQQAVEELGVLLEDT